MRSDVTLKDAYVVIYDVTGQTAYALYNNRASEANNAMTSYTVCGGENEPFEYVKIKIPRKKFVQVAGPLTADNALVAGKNRIHIDALGKGDYTYASSMLSGDTYTITAYCDAYKITQMEMTSEITGTPIQIIETLLTSPLYGNIITGNFIRQYIPPDNDDKLTFKSGYSIWYVVQVCAWCLGCKIFFTGDGVYLIDYRVVAQNLINPNSSKMIATDSVTGAVVTYENPPKDTGGYDTSVIVNGAVIDYDVIDLYTSDTTKPEYARITGNIKLGNEGVTTIVNQVTVTCKNSVNVTVRDEKAIKKYNNTVRNKGYNLDMLVETTDTEIEDALEQNKISAIKTQGSRFATNILDYVSEGQQSVEFTMKELIPINGDTHWMPFFTPSSRIKGINDTVDDVYVSNTSVLNETIIKPQKLILSSYTRNFPEGTTTYKFGVISSVDLQSKLNEMTTAQQNS